MDLVCHMTKCTPTSMVASARIARFIADTLHLPLLHTVEEIEHVRLQVADKGLRRFILVNSPTAFAPQEMRLAVADFVHSSEEAIYAHNDYKLRPPSQCKSQNLRKHGYTPGESIDYYGMRLWTNMPVREQDLYINWNELTYNPQPQPTQPRKHGLVYWGALRKGREDRIRRFFNTDAYPTVISTAGQSVKKFREFAHASTQYVTQFKNMPADLTQFEATVYIHDKFNDHVYNSPPNRFYEAVSAGLALFVHQPCVYSLERAGYTVQPAWIVRNSDEIAKRLPYAASIARDQAIAWQRDVRPGLVDQLQQLQAHPVQPQRRGK